MKVSGENFLKNLEIEMEKNKLREQTDNLDQQKEESIQFSINSNSYETTTDANIDELDNIVLNKRDNNKQKYIILGFALVLLFLITVLVIRLVSQPNKQNAFTDNVIEDQFLNTFDDDKKRVNIDNKLDINTIEKIIPEKSKTAIRKKTNKEIKSDIFEINKKKTVEENNIKQIFKPTKKIEKKVIAIKEPIKQILVKKLPIKLPNKNKTQNYYIQIGAFLETPDKTFINILKKNKLNYIFRKVKIKNKKFTKILIGPYGSRLNAEQYLNEIRITVKNKSAFIIGFK
jgi:hypothetical protein